MRNDRMILFLLGQSLATFAGAIHALSISIWLLRMTGDATSLASYAFVCALPTIVFTVCGGQLADKLPALQTLRLGQILKVIIMVGFVLIMGKFIPFSMALIFLLEILSRIVSCLEGPAIQKFLVLSSVGNSSVRAQGMFSLFVFSAQTAAYLLGGVLVKSLGQEYLGGVVACLFLVLIVLVLYLINTEINSVLKLSGVFGIKCGADECSLFQVLGAKEVGISLLLLVVFSLSGAR